MAPAIDLDKLYSLVYVQLLLSQYFFLVSRARAGEKTLFEFIRIRIYIYTLNACACVYVHVIITRLRHLQCKTTRSGLLLLRRFWRGSIVLLLLLQLLLLLLLLLQQLRGCL